jgi:hypothetical protein
MAEGTAFRRHCNMVRIKKAVEKLLSWKKHGSKADANPTPHILRLVLQAIPPGLLYVEPVGDYIWHMRSFRDLVSFGCVPDLRTQALGAGSDVARQSD